MTIDSLASVLRGVALAALALSVIYWIGNAIATVMVTLKVPQLGRINSPQLAEWPSVSVVIPACNEGATLASAMNSKLTQDYPSVEFILIDDRSTDATGTIVDDIAARDTRVRPVHIVQLPDGWLGKLYALHIGVHQAKGDWLLFSDADVHFEPDALRRAIAYCESEKIDHLAVFPDVFPTNVLLDSTIATFGRLGFVSSRIWSVPDPKSRAAAGVGAFNLVRRSSFQRTKGFEWLKLEVADDVALGQMLKQAGGRSVAAIGRGVIGIQLYRSIREAARGSEKGAALFGFNLPRVVAACIAISIVEFAPWIALMFGWRTWVGNLAAGVILCSVIVCASLARRIGLRSFPAAIVPLGAASMLILTLRAGILAARNKGISWRGTRYSSTELMAGRRLQLG